MSEVRLRFVSGAEIDSLQLTPQEILAAVEDALRAQGQGQVVLEPRMHLFPPNGGEETLHAELGAIVAGHAPGRERAEERILLWHRGLATSDIAVAHLILRRAEQSGVGTLVAL